MPAICPNCLRPVRTGAKYCGFCGTDLYPVAHAVPSPAASPAQEANASDGIAAPQARPKPSRKTIRRTVLIVLIILLCLVLLLAFFLHFWPVLVPSLGHILSLFKPFRI